MSDIQVALAVLIFAVTYAVIAFAKIPRLHLDRPGAALCGAALMVACGVLSFDDAWSAIDARTIVLLLGMMILNVLLEESGFFELAARKVLGGGRSPLGLLRGLVMLSAVLSALFLNDTVCLMLTLPVLAIVRKSNLPAAPYLIALATSANIGSVATLVGNPQNMLIGSYSGISYGEFLLWMTPVAVMSVVVLIAALQWFYGDALRAAASTPALVEQGAAPRVDLRLLIESLVVLAGVLVGFVLVDNLPLVAIAGAAVLLIVSRRPTAAVLSRVDWVLLAFFAALFIVVRGLEATGLVANAAARVRPMYGTSLVTQIPVFSAVTVLASNLVSNVPFVVLARGVVPELIEPQLMWLVLSMASTLAGNLTIPGSVATLIVLETARRHQPGRESHVGFLEFFRIGLPVTVITVTLGALVLAAEHWLVTALR